MHELGDDHMPTLALRPADFLLCCIHLCLAHPHAARCSATEACRVLPGQSRPPDWICCRVVEKAKPDELPSHFGSSFAPTSSPDRSSLTSTTSEPRPLHRSTHTTFCHNTSKTLSGLHPSSSCPRCLPVNHHPGRPQALPPTSPRRTSTAMIS